MPLKVANLKPDEAVVLQGIHELAQFEEFVGQAIDPAVSTVDLEWGGRVALRELVKPPKFYGNLLNLKMQVMRDPYHRLLDANERGLQFNNSAGSSQRKLRGEDIDDLIKKYRGFLFSAEAHTTGKGLLYTVSAEMWYAPSPGEVRVREGQRKRVSVSSGRALVRRFTTKPITDAESSHQYPSSSRTIGFSRFLE